MRWRLTPKGSIFPPSFLHLSPLFLLFGSQKRFSVNNSWNRREISCTSTMGLVLREPLLRNHFCCFFFSPCTFYSTPIAPVCTTSTHRDPEPWGTQNSTATSTHRRPITTTWGWVTLKESQKPSRGTPEVSDKDIADLQHCFCVPQQSRKGSLQRLPVKGVSKHVTLAFRYPLPSVSFLPVLPFSPPFIPWGRGRSS